MKDKPIKFLGVLGVITTASLMGAGEAQAIIALDTFDVDHDIQRDNTGTSTGTFDQSSENFTNSILGGERDVVFNVTNVGAFQNTSADFSGDGKFDLNEAGGSQANVTLTYDGDDNDPNTLSPSGFGITDITDGGNAGGNGGNNTGFLFEIGTGGSTGQGNVEVSLFDSNGNTATAQELNFVAGTPEVFFDFSGDFSFSTFDFTQVTAAEIKVSSDAADDSVSFDAVGFANPGDTFPPAAPVPFEAETSIALALLGSWGAWKYWRKRRTQANDINSLS